ncbi:MAG: cysteine hydrolase [Acidobacteriaceae bacterium]|nr:cysteine hydrolase [Acidobacteriaceae bacterium]
MKTVFFDVDTQLDFLCPAGALYVPGAERLSGNLAKLTRYAAENGIPIVSTVDAHTEDDPEFKIWKPHCVLGTAGQQKLGATLLAKPVVISATLAVDFEAARAAKQIVVEKQKLDPFTNPHLSALLNDIAADRFVVYGVVSEFCVRCALEGLIQRGARVELVTDAIRSLDQEKEREMITRFTGVGGFATVTTAAVCN